MMRVLLANDDGIDAEGLLHLAAVVREFADVWIVAPVRQCSAMSHRITVRQPMRLTQVSYPLEGVKAWALDGMPADCVKIGLQYLDIQPDFVISGVNHGTNLGFDTFYSGTVACAVDARIHKIPSIAVSNESKSAWELVDLRLGGILKELMKRPLEAEAFWNVNFPDCSPQLCRGILWDRKPAPAEIFSPEITVSRDEDGQLMVCADGCVAMEKAALPGTDVEAVLNKYISVGKIICNRLV